MYHFSFRVSGRKTKLKLKLFPAKKKITRRQTLFSLPLPQLNSIDYSNYISFGHFQKRNRVMRN